MLQVQQHRTVIRSSILSNTVTRRTIATTTACALNKIHDEAFHLPYNVTLIGPPGSGKGYYGGILSAAWNHTPIYTTSTILREYYINNSNDDDNENADISSPMNHSSSSNFLSSKVQSKIIQTKLDSGTLVDCEDVSRIVLSFLQEQRQKQQQEETTMKELINTNPRQTTTNIDDTKRKEIMVKSADGDDNEDAEDDLDRIIEHDDALCDVHPYYTRRKQQKTSHFIMDGYPRTKQQIDIMVSTWPLEYQLTHAIHLQIPDIVCINKILGRRYCVKCHGEPNVANVQYRMNKDDVFDLPPIRPLICKAHLCRPTIHWIQTRKDDTDRTIVEKRLLNYRLEEDLLLQHYKRTSNQQQQYCLSVTPFRGILDFPKVQKQIEQWLIPP